MNKNKCKKCNGRGEYTIDYILPKSARFKDENGKEVKAIARIVICECSEEKQEEIQIACGPPSEIILP